jgi:PAS domain S-box-containing protein
MPRKIDVLIVDDEEQIRSLFYTMLEHAGVRDIYVCESLGESVGIVASHNVDVVVLDLFLGEIGGVDTVSAFKELFPDLPVVVVTGYDQDGLSYKCFESGASDFLIKPEVSQMLLYKSCVYAVERDIIQKHSQMESERANTYLDIAGVMMLVLDKNGDIVLINKKGCDILGYDSADELVGKNWFDTCIRPEDRDRIEQVFLTVVGASNTKVVQCENAVVRKDGSTRFVSWRNSNTPYRGEIVSLSSGEDITKQKVMMDALKASEHRYRRLFESAQDGIIILDFDTGQILDVNKYLLDLLGYTHKEYLGKKVWEIGPLSEVISNKNVFLELKQKGYVRYESRVASSGSGEPVNVEFISNSYRVNGQTFIQCNIRNITARVVLEERQRLIIRILKLLNAPYSVQTTISDLLEMIQEFTGIEAIALRLQEGEDYPYFMYKGFDQSFIFLENFLCRTDNQGCNVFDEHGKPILDCMCGCVIRGNVDKSLPFFTPNGSFWTNSTTELLEANAGQPLSSSQMKTRNRCNTEGYESVAIIPLSTGSDIIGSIQLNDSRKGVFTLGLIGFMEELALTIGVAVARAWQEDRIKILEVAKTKDLLQSSRQLNSGIAHELRTPLQAIFNSFEIMKAVSQEECPNQLCTRCTSSCSFREEMVQMAEGGIDRSSYSIQVLDSLSEYSKAASSEELHLINLFTELNTIIKTLRYTDYFKCFSAEAFRLVDRTSRECSIMMNRVDFSQLIINLCRNAREAIDHDHPCIQIVLDLVDNESVITIQDNGKGIKSDLGDTIFEPYFSTKENPDSHNQGLGLSIVKNIVLAYGGNITYNSRSGCTEFILKFSCIQEQTQEE